MSAWRKSGQSLERPLWAIERVARKVRAGRGWSSPIERVMMTPDWSSAISRFRLPSALMASQAPLGELRKKLFVDPGADLAHFGLIAELSEAPFVEQPNVLARSCAAVIGFAWQPNA